jgi:phosphate starvation-inducible PhoH-like protein
MSKQHAIKVDELYTYEPLTENQKKAYNAWDDGEHLCLTGTAGTGKTFIALYLALEAVLEKQTAYHKITVIRSVVPTRDMGFLPGSLAEKQEVFETPYKNIMLELLGDDTPYRRLVHNHQLEFITTSYIRGMTIDNSIIIVDEMQNLNFHELDSVITRVGQNCRLIFCGDYHQSDFREGSERDGIMKFMRIIESMKNFTTVTFGWEDIVRSDFVRDYIMTKEMLGIR